MSLIVWVFFLSVVLMALRSASRPFAIRRPMKLVLLPGLLLASAAQCLACFLGKAEIKRVNLPWRAGEPVEHGDPKVPLFGPTVLATLPFTLGLIAVLVARTQLEPRYEAGYQLPDVDASIEGVATFLSTCKHVLLNAPLFPADTSLLGWKIAAICYFALSVLVYTSPTWKEWKWIAGCLCVAAVPVAAVSYLGLEPGFFSRGWFIQRSFGPRVFEGLALLFAMSWLGLVLVGAARAIWVVSRASLVPSRKEAKAHA